MKRKFQKRSERVRKISPSLITIVSFAILGLVLLTRSLASSAQVGVDPELGSVNGSASIGTDTTASGGKYVQFNKASSSQAKVITAAGDIACDPAVSTFNNLNGTPTECQMKATANTISTINPDAALTLGDNQYESGILTNFMASYDKTWGKFKAITHPSIGNHEGGEGQTHSNAGYFDYFNGTGVQTGAAGDRSKGYYSYDVGTWHLIALNSNCGTYWFGGVQSGCQAGSPQEVWLRQDLAASSAKCTLAYWHVPRFSSGSSHHNDASTDTIYTTLWNDLYAAKADIVLNGHDHDYERFGPQQPNGTADAANGIREFIVGTGGRNHYGFTSVVGNSEVRNNTSFGVLKLTLHPTSYDWQFIDTSGTVIDSGSTSCH